MNRVITIIAGGVALWGVVHILTRYTFWRPWRPAAWPRLLMYHQVHAGPASGMNCPPPQFERHLQWLTRLGYRFATVSELPGLSGKVAALTFDDGYRDNYECLYPLLERYGAKATIYLAPHIPGIERLTDEQILEMSRSGLVEFGAHTMNHVNLSRLEPAEAEREIRESKRTVEQIVGRPCNTFSYPFGRYTPEHVSLVKAAGFTSAVTTRKRIAPFAAQPFELPRISIHGGMNRLQFHIALGTGKFRV